MADNNYDFDLINDVEKVFRKEVSDYFSIESNFLPPIEEKSKPSTESKNKDEWIQVFSGRKFFPTNPYIDAITIDDIAHSLSLQCRFNGHCKKFYSVSQHSVLVSYICDSSDKLHGLLHDASEAYLTDLPTPLKRSGKFEEYLEYENNLQRLIFKRFNLTEDMPHSVKEADKLLLSTEARDLLGPLHSEWKMSVDPLPFKIQPLSPEDSKDLFMKRFYELTGMVGAYENYLYWKNK